MLLAGALGLDHEVQTAPDPAELARAAAVLLTSQLGEQPIKPWLEATLAEIERAQLND